MRTREKIEEENSSHSDSPIAHHFTLDLVLEVMLDIRDILAWEFPANKKIN